MLKITTLALALSFATLAPVAALACGEEKAQVTQVSPKEGVELQKKGATFVDANGKETRAKYGVIPGAILLTSYTEFNADKELPAKKDSKLVFYCANTKCGASFEAANKAMAAGYTDVAVLPDGIKGWKDAGLPTATPKANNS
ncbi:MAG: rhodanese-like domain-containing protein [Deltaproteobacteria bacterium]|jgi:rhodanese-related sulfurtransferase|nr:rhodanese-like domain-containing protein [Deltaproteobacteria bacterium]